MHVRCEFLAQRGQPTMHSEIAPNTHPASARKGPEPSVALSARFVSLARAVKPPRMVPHRGSWVDADVAVEAIGCCSDAYAAGDLILSEGAGAVWGHARLAAWDRRLESES